MAFFGTGKNERIQSRLHDERVEISDTIQGYRHASWDPYDILHDIQSAALDATSVGDHLWTSNERLQMLAAASWLTSVHQSIGHSLISQTEKNGSLPLDVSDIALRQYELADSWLKKREAIENNPSFSLDTPNLPLETRWPSPDRQTISPELFAAVVQLPGQLIDMSLPTLLRAIDTTSFLPPEYSPYNKRVTNEAELIQKHMNQLLLSYNEHLNPNTAPGNEVYNGFVDLTERIIQFGVNALVPVTGDRFYKLPPKKPSKKEDQNAFSSKLFRAPHPTPNPITNAPAFNPTAAKPEAPDSQNPVLQPGGEAFNPSITRYHLPEDPPQTEAEAFNPQRYRPPQNENTSEAFDPKKYRPN